MKITRREVFGAVGGSAATVAVVGGLRPELFRGSPKPEGAPAVPWEYAALDPAATAERAYAGFWASNCMFGVFESIVGQLGERLGEPYASFPFGMMRYGVGGVMGWSTLCGALNGAAAAGGLVSPKLGAFVQELFTWYEQTALPEFEPSAPKVKLEPMPRSAAGSTLCHVSIGRWVKTAKVRADSQERYERCGRLSATVAGKAVQILNAQLDGSFVPQAKTLPENERCQTCHTKPPDPNLPIQALCNAQGKMACTTCHQDIKIVGANHPADKLQK